MTGALPLALGKSTKVVHALLKSGKEYVCLMHLHRDVTQSKIHKTSKEFIGKINQLPPRRSAVKRKLRIREIYYLNIYEIEGRDVLFKVGCEAGTYIRKLVHDWGEALGVGAHMQELIRTKAGPFTDKNWVTLHDLKDAFEIYKEGNDGPLKKLILPMEKAVEHLPKVWINDSAVDTICHGADLSVPGIVKLHSGIKKEDLVAVMTLKEELVCFGSQRMTSEEIMENEKGIAVRTDRVFMDPGIYPKFVKKKPESHS